MIHCHLQYDLFPFLLKNKLSDTSPFKLLKIELTVAFSLLYLDRYNLLYLYSLNDIKMFSSKGTVK